MATKNKVRMAVIVRTFQEYVNTYSNQRGYTEYSDRTFIEDMLYGIGIAVDEDRYKNADGYAEFKEYLKEQGVTE